MRAAVFRGVGRPLEITELQVDRPGPHEILIRTGAAGLCHTDLSLLTGRISGFPAPMVIGHESAGMVEAIGPMVTYVKPGDHVVTSANPFCGTCAYCLTGRPVLCSGPDLTTIREGRPRLSEDGREVHQFVGLGSFAERLLVHENAVVKVDPELPFDIAALLGCSVMTGLGAVLNTARVRPGSTVAVIGCGGVGLSAIQGAQIAGARRVFGIDIAAARLEAALRLGATDAIDSSQEDPVAAVGDATGGGVDYSFEVVGSKATSEQAIAMLCFSGTATLVGLGEGED